MCYKKIKNHFVKQSTRIIHFQKSANLTLFRFHTVKKTPNFSR